jgi:hypothetical protein
MARSYPGQPANPPYPPPPAPEANPAGPPAAPSSRQMNAGYDVQPLPSFENTPIDMVAETVEAIPDEEPNPFQKTGRFDRFKKLLKKPSREMSIRVGLAAAALLVGWSAGAKPWKSDPPRAAMSAKASAAAKAGSAAKASKAGARPAAARPTAAAAVAKAEAPRRVAVVAHDSPPVLAKRAETKAALASKSKVTTKSVTAKAAATKALKSKAKAANKVTAKKQATKTATAKAALKAKAKAKPKAVAKKATATHG